MSEVQCGACGGDGMQSTPHAAYDGEGRPIIEMVLTLCVACGGNGKVEV